MYVCEPVSIKKKQKTTHTHHTWIYLRLICNINYCMSPSFSNAPPPHIRICTYVQAGHGKARHTRRLLTPVCIPAHSKKGLCWKWREMKVTTQCQCVTVVHVCALSENGNYTYCISPQMLNWDMKHTTRQCTIEIWSGTTFFQYSLILSLFLYVKHRGTYTLTYRERERERERGVTNICHCPPPVHTTDHQHMAPELYSTNNHCLWWHPQRLGKFGGKRTSDY